MGLILDHANGVADDNHIENLRILCPNCDATLDTHCRRANRMPVEARTCLYCGGSYQPRFPSQKYCSRICGRHSRKPRDAHPERRWVERPPYVQLMAELAESNWSAVARRHGVSDNAVRKWVRWYEAGAARRADGGEPSTDGRGESGAEVSG